MTRDKLKQLNEMHICLSGLAAVTEALNNPVTGIMIVTGYDDCVYSEMSVRRSPEFEQAFGDFIRSYYCNLQKAFDAE